MKESPHSLLNKIVAPKSAANNSQSNLKKHNIIICVICCSIAVRIKLDFVVIKYYLVLKHSIWYHNRFRAIAKTNISYQTIRTIRMVQHLVRISYLSSNI